jgi:hypothetical protein
MAEKKVTELEYQYGTDPSYSPTAAETFNVELVPSPEKPYQIYLDGPCPRCKHRMNHVHELILIRGVSPVDEATAEAVWDALHQRGTEPPTQWEFQVDCACRITHPKSEEHKTACGAFWNMLVERQREEDTSD